MATDFLEYLTPSSLLILEPYASTLSVLLNERGGIIDDMMITKHASDAQEHGRPGVRSGTPVSARKTAL
jgi:glycine cleavage system aminomethyltransferase T